MANEHVTQCFNSLVNRELQIKTTGRYYYIPVKMPGGSINWYIRFEKMLMFSIKSEYTTFHMLCMCRPSNSLLGIYITAQCTHT